MSVVPATSASPVEYFDLLNSVGAKTGIVKDRKKVHADGDWHRAVHVWLYVLSSDELLLQQRAVGKDAWPSLWDMSCAGHLKAGDDSLPTVQRELQEELGLQLPLEAIEPLFSMQSSSITNAGTFRNNEFVDVYLVTVVESIPLEALTLAPDEVQAVRYMDAGQAEAAFTSGDPAFVPLQSADAEYAKLFEAVRSKRGRPLDGSSLIPSYLKTGQQTQLVSWQQAVRQQQREESSHGQL